MPKKKASNLYLRFRQPDGKQSPYCPALYDNKSRVRPFWCRVRGTEEHHPEGSYYRRFKRDGKWAWESLGSDANTADCKATAGANWERQLAKSQSPAPAAERQSANNGYRLDGEVSEYLSNVAKLAPKTYKAYKRTLELFQQSCKKVYVHQIGKQDLQAFDTFLMQRGDEDRTRHNRIQHVVTFLRNKEGRRRGPEITNVSIRVKYVEAPPEAYTRQELEDLFRVSDEDERLLWRFFLGSGFRESEASVAEVSDVNRDTKTMRVDEKPWFGFKPKDCEKREVPISDALIAEIDARMKSGSCSPLFDNNGRPEGYLLRRLKQFPFCGGLNCGKGVGIR